MKQMLKKFLKKIKDGSSLPCYIISREPIVLISFWHDMYTNAEEIFKLLPAGKSIHFLFQIGWHRETKERVDDIVEKIHQLNKLRPGVEYHFLCNSKKEESLFQESGLDGRLCHQNAFVDPDYFPIVESIHKKYDAVYTARITPFKRHLLAANIATLRLIGDYHDHESDYAKEVLSALKQVEWSRRVHFTSVYKELNKARVGLCLSEEEGAMFASIEYLLCGLPVVSTPNVGGRDFFFEKEFSRVVEPTPESVASGVEELIALNIDPKMIRGRVIEKMMTQREVFIEIVQKIFDKENVQKSMRDQWDEVFTHKFAIRTSMPWFGKAKNGRLSKKLT